MNVGQDTPASKKKPDAPDSSATASEKKSETEEPKPRIVLTFRSEKPGAKSSSMKIVSSEEKLEKVEEVSPRRSTRVRPLFKYDSWDDTEAMTSPKKAGQVISESDESESPNSKRSTRGCSKEVDSSEKEPTATPTRLSRRIKPTPKVLENEELRIGFESQNNARLGLQTEKSPEEGVRTRRSVRSKQSVSEDTHESVKATRSRSKEVAQELDGDTQNQVLKLKHLCELGLKARSPDSVEGSKVGEEKQAQEQVTDEIAEEWDANSEVDDQEVDDDSEVIIKLLEDDDDTDEDFIVRKRRSSRLQSRDVSDSSPSSPGEHGEPRRRRSRRKLARREVPYGDAPMPPKPRAAKRARDPSAGVDDGSEPASGEAGSEAAQPSDASAVVATCTCEAPSSLYAAPDDNLLEPLFCQAIETVDGVRVGCSHGARRAAGGACAALVRCGPRAPFVRLCALHHHQMAKHMCCTTCGLFCTQGTFYQCSSGHLFHAECGLLLSDGKRLPPGCPHCGLRPDRGEPANRACARVAVRMRCSNKRVFMHDQREQCTTAYLGFTPVFTDAEDSPVIPEDLLPSPPIDLKKLCVRAETSDGDQEGVETLLDAILAGETVERLIPIIMSGAKVNAPLASAGGGTCVHAAAKRGHVAATYLVHYAGADLNATDAQARTPLMVAVLALLEKSDNKSPKKSKINADAEEKEEEMEVDESGPKEEDDKIGGKEIERASDEDLFKVIRYLVAAGCDVNIAGPDGMTALHMAAQYGGTAVCEALLAGTGALVDPRDHGGWTPLVWAAENCHADTVRLLLRMGADATATDSEGNAAVHWCALAGAARALHLLLDAAPLAAHALNRHTDTPLHVAARQGHYACVVILLARGARTDVENSAGELPVEVCSGQCQTAISLNMQMTLALRTNLTRHRLLSGDISRGRELYPVPCVNEVDDTPLPDDFTYVTSHVMPTNIVIDNTLQTMKGCACSGGECSSVECACISLGVRRWSQGARLRPDFPHHDPPMLFTCNDTCGCDAKKCTNMAMAREIAKGSVFVRAQVFRVGGARGWGLRALSKVSRGTLVATYCGELLTVADADTRSADQYMFALDVKPDLLEQCALKTQLCVDAHTFGGAARFMNHSCRPNVACVRVFTGSRDLRLPAVALFATRTVPAGGELTFDYGDKFWSVKSKWMKCECGDSECRYPNVAEEAPQETGDK